MYEKYCEIFGCCGGCGDYVCDWNGWCDEECVVCEFYSFYGWEEVECECWSMCL